MGSKSDALTQKSVDSDMDDGGTDYGSHIEDDGSSEGSYDSAAAAPHCPSRSASDSYEALQRLHSLHEEKRGGKNGKRFSRPSAPVQVGEGTSSGRQGSMEHR